MMHDEQETEILGHDELPQDATEVDILRFNARKQAEKIAELEAEIDDTQNRYLRARADLENYRRRVQDDLAMAQQSGLDSALGSVFDVFDDLQRALQAAAQSTDATAIASGVQGVSDGLERALNRLGIDRVGNAGEPFDPQIHEALSTIPAQDNAAPGSIYQVFSAGFQQGNRLIRPARVVVVEGESE